MARILVTGGAGYIGAHACKLLADQGHEPICFDNLSTGWRQAVQFGPLVEASLLDPAALKTTFTEWQPDAVMHFAASSLVGEAEDEPAKYWENNVIGSYNLLTAMREARCDQLVFSSTCAVYGMGDGSPLNEQMPLDPVNVYGRTKRAIEDMVQDFGRAYGLRSVILRYFNVAGADPSGLIGEDHQPETHLIPLVLAAANGDRENIALFGTDYDTPDGTCIRDYIHVLDLIDAHIRGIDWLQDGQTSQIINLGTGHGYSVRAVIEAAQEVTELPIAVVDAPRRAGDPACLVSGSEKATSLMGWRPQRSSLPAMIGDAWAWYKSGRYNS